MRRAIRERLDELARQGFVIAAVRQGRTHIKLNVVTPTGRPMMIVVGATPSDRRAQHNFAAADQTLRL